MRIPIYQVDAFTRKVFAGNPAAVCPLSEWLPDDVMQNIAAENNLAETAFFVRKEDHYELRWFTPVVEMPLCGHATLASAFVIFNCLNSKEDVLKFQTKSGLLKVERQDNLLVLDFPSRPPRESELPEGVVEAIGKIPQKVYEAQGHMLMLLFENEADIRSIKPNFSALKEINYNEFFVTAKGDEADFVSRMFAPRLGIDEDPVTGAIHCSLIPYWAENLGKTKLFAKQVSARGGELFCELAGERVKIAGQAVLYMTGEIEVDS